MKIPKSYEGQLVCIHLGAPVYMFEYGAHMQLDGRELVTPAPVVRQVQGKEGAVQSQAMSNLLIAVRVAEVADDSIAVDIFADHKGDPKRCSIIRKRVPSALVMSIDTVTAFDVEMPVPVQQIVQAPKPLVQL